MCPKSGQKQKNKNKPKKSVVSLGGLMASGKRAGFMDEHCQALRGAQSVQAVEWGGLDDFQSNFQH